MNIYDNVKKIFTEDTKTTDSLESDLNILKSQLTNQTATFIKCLVSADKNESKKDISNAKFKLRMMQEVIDEMEGIMEKLETMF